MNPLCLDQGVGLIPWSPLARGFLAGNRHRGNAQGSDHDGAAHAPTTRARSDDFAHRLYYQDSDFDIVDAVGTIAKARGVSHAQVALAWLLGRPGVSAPIIGASKPHHLDEALAALDLTLSAEECRVLEAPYRPHAVLGHG